MKTKVLRRYVDNIAGFPVVLNNVEFVFLRGEWVPKINYLHLDREILKQLVYYQGRLTGSHIRFIRRHFKMTLKTFAERFCVSHVAVIKWEKKQNKPTDMAWGIEKDIRMFTQSQISKKPKELAVLYSFLEVAPKQKKVEIIINAIKFAA